MIKKYMIAVLLPCLFQSLVYCQEPNTELNKVIEKSLRAARDVMRKPYLALNLDSVLNELLNFAQQENHNKFTAEQRAQAIKIDLERYKSEQYSWFGAQWFSSAPAIVRDEIQPAINKVDDVLKKLNQTQPMNWVDASYYATGALATVGLVGCTYYLIKKGSPREERTKEQMRRGYRAIDD